MGETLPAPERCCEGQTGEDGACQRERDPRPSLLAADLAESKRSKPRPCGGDSRRSQEGAREEAAAALPAPTAGNPSVPSPPACPAGNPCAPQRPETLRAQPSRPRQLCDLWLRASVSGITAHPAGVGGRDRSRVPCAQCARGSLCPGKGQSAPPPTPTSPRPGPRESSPLRRAAWEGPRG